MQVSYARERLQNHSNEGKGKEKKKEQEEGKEEKGKSNCFTLSFYNSYLEFLAEKNVRRKRSIWR